MEGFVIIVNGLQQLTIIARHSILDVAVVLDPPQIPLYVDYSSLSRNEDYTITLARTNLSSYIG